MHIQCNADYIELKNMLEINIVRNYSQNILDIPGHDINF